MNSKVKTLYKLSRKQLFSKEYYCMYCDMTDCNKDWIWKHIRNIHDENGKIIRLFVCRKSNKRMIEWDIINHILKNPCVEYLN